MTRILIVEDDIDIRGLLARARRFVLHEMEAWR